MFTVLLFAAVTLKYPYEGVDKLYHSIIFIILRCQKKKSIPPYRIISFGHNFLCHQLKAVHSLRYLIGFLPISSVCCYSKKPLCPSTLLMSALPLERSEPRAPRF